MANRPTREQAIEAMVAVDKINAGHYPHSDRGQELTQGLQRTTPQDQMRRIAHYIAELEREVAQLKAQSRTMKNRIDALESRRR